MGEEQDDDDDWGTTPTGVPKDEFVILRKQGLVEIDQERYMMALQV